MDIFVPVFIGYFIGALIMLTLTEAWKLGLVTDTHTVRYNGEHVCTVKRLAGGLWAYRLFAWPWHITYSQRQALRVTAPIATDFIRSREAIHGRHTD